MKTSAADAAPAYLPPATEAPQSDLLRQQESLRAVIESISSELELRSLLTRIVHHACELLGAEKGSIGLVDEERGVVRTEAIYQMPPGELGAEMLPGVGLAGQVFQTGEPVLLNRYGDVDRPLYPDSLEDAVLGMPIRWGERIIGFFGIGSPPPRRFTPADLEVLSLFARHAAIAIENARRYEREQRRTERLAVIARIGQIITANLDLSDLLQRAADAIHDLLGYPYIAIVLPDWETPGGLRFAATAGGDATTAPTLNFRLPFGQGIVGTAAVERRPVLIQDVQQEPRYIPTPGTVNIRSELAIPILLGSRLLGVLNAESQHLLDEDDRMSLQIIADQLAVAIENARLYTGARQALEETRLLYQTSRRISTAMDVEEVVRAYLEQVAARSRTPYACTIVRYDREECSGKRTAVRVLGRWAPGEGIVLSDERVPVIQDDLDPLLDAGMTVAIRDVFQDARVAPELREMQARAGRPALALIPLIVHGVRTGVVALSYPHPHDWPEEDLHAYQATAALLAAALETRRQQSLLFERGQQIAVLEERGRLARDLHDSVTQLLFSMTLIAQSIGGAWQRDPAEGERRVERLLELSRLAHSEMRGLLAEWRPVAPSGEDSPLPLEPMIPAVRSEGLAGALARHIAARRSDDMAVRLDARGYRRQSVEREEALYRIAQEALANAAKHSRAETVTVRLFVNRDSITVMRIQDSGRGFAATQERRRTSGTGMGLSTMRERAEALGGTLRLRSAPGKGTIVEVRLPPAAPTDADSIRSQHN